MTNITVILPVLNEAENLKQTINAIEDVTDSQFLVTFMVVDDGSSDETWSKLKQLSNSKSIVKGLSLSRNFGKEQAILAGIQATTTEAAIVMDGDLQHPAEVIPRLIEKWQETGCDVVHANKIDRTNESSSDSFLVKIFYFVYKLSTGTSLQHASDFKLLNRRALDEYSKLRERDLFFRGLVPWLGFHQEVVTYKTAERTNGSSKWSLFHRITTAIFAITSFSVLPLQIVTLMGILFLAGAVSLGSYTLYEWWNGTAVEGFTTVVLLLLLVGATLMISLGIIGQYLARIYDEVKGRPVYIVKDKIGL